MKFINLIGVEMEGGWDGVQGIVPFADGTTLVDDQSLSGLESTHVGEAVSPALPFDQVLEWMAVHHPKYVNIKCGLHVHVSFKSPRFYLGITRRGFKRFFLDKIKEWAEGEGLNPGHAFWERWAGENKYCSKDFRPTRQMRRDAKHPPGEGNAPLFPQHERRTQWNFCYGVHGTAECRMLPMFNTPEQSIRAVAEVVHIVENYLTLKPPVMEKFSRTARLYPNAVNGEIRHEINVPISTAPTSTSPKVKSNFYMMEEE